MAGLGDGISGDLARGGLTEPQPHRHSGVPQPGEESRLVSGLLRCFSDDVSEHGTRRRRWQAAPR
jgi:hypothetical protein